MSCYSILKCVLVCNVYIVFIVVESPSDTSINLPSSASQTEIATNNNNSKTSSVDAQVSPTPSRQSRG